MALLVAASLSKNELYISSPMPAGPDLRQSTHASGKGHVHTPAGRLLHDERAALATFSGKRQLWSAAPDLGLLSWTYKPKPDKKNRRTLLLSTRYFGIDYPSCTVAIVGVEQGRADLVDEALADYPIVIDWALLDHTQPQLLAVAWTLTAESAAALDRATAGVQGCEQPLSSPLPPSTA